MPHHQNESKRLAVEIKSRIQAYEDGIPKMGPFEEWNEETKTIMAAAKELADLTLNTKQRGVGKASYARRS